MADVVFTVASFVNDQCLVQIVYDDVTLVLSRAQVVNNTDKPATITLSRAGASRSYTCPANSTIGRNLPSGFRFERDVDGELTMPDLNIGASWGP